MWPTPTPEQMRAAQNVAFADSPPVAVPRLERLENGLVGANDMLDAACKRAYNIAYALLGPPPSVLSGPEATVGLKDPPDPSRLDKLDALATSLQSKLLDLQQVLQRLESL